MIFEKENSMRRYLTISSALIAVIALFAACSTSVPKDAKDNHKTVTVFPDYMEVTIPYNIAPLNFHVDDDDAEDYVSVVEDKNGNQLVAGGQDAQFDEDDWHALLAENKGKNLTVTVYVQKQGQWEKYKPFTISVAEDPIDEYISYRYIEPGYQNYNDLTLNQRNLTNFDESIIFSNKMLSGVDMESEYQCINCHACQNYHTDNLQFHIRQYKGGTIIVNDGKAEKCNMKTDSTIASGVYPAWHPTEPVIAYSVNNTVQAFLIKDADHKIEVMDTLSDLILYYVDTNDVQIVQKTNDSYETFPSWSPDGKTLYYCSAYFPIVGKKHHFEMGNHYDKLYYDLIRQSYDYKTRTLGEPDTVFKASEKSKSASQPRISPDGRYLLFSMSDYGYFNIHHVMSDLYVQDLRTYEVRPLKAMSSDKADSYHAWSSNGRWIVFSTRREDGNYTRLYIGYFDKNGKDHKAFALPQKSPLYNKEFMKSFNVPEFMVEPVKISPRELAEAASKEAKSAKLYK